MKNDKNHTLRLALIGCSLIATGLCLLLSYSARADEAGAALAQFDKPELLKITDHIYQSTFSGACTWFLLSRSGKAMTRYAVYERVCKHSKKAGITKRMSPHKLRHTCATHLLQNNANLRHVQDILGHRSLNTTERYLSLTITDLKEAHRKFHPREQQNKL